MYTTTELDRMTIENKTFRILSRVFTDTLYCNDVTSTILDEVIEDIEICADEDYNDSDISLAVQRTLLKKIGCDV